MGDPTSPVYADGPVLFVAREPDETLRTFLPITDLLQREHGRPCRVLFHHTPGPWARDALVARGIGLDEVSLPKRIVPARLAPVPGSSTVDEIARLRHARSLARAAIDRHRPSAVVVIQDTLLLERFVVREANRRGIPTLVVQWAFSYAQAMYDRIREFQYGKGTPDDRSLPRRVLAPLTRSAYRTALRAFGLSFDLANSYGGGEAHLFAVMGEAFRDQFLAQGVRGKRIVVCGHPTHDTVYQRAQTVDAAERARIRQSYDLPQDRTLVLYATQPVLWRKVMTREALERNVRTMAETVAGQTGCELILKLHPREDAADYAFCADLTPPVRVLTQAEMPDLIAACDLFISSSSSTVLLAMMLDRPIITVNFDEVPHFDQFEGIGGTVHVRTHEAFAAAFGRLLADDDARAELARQRADVIARYTRFDGHAAERIAGLLVDAIEAPSRVQPTPASPTPEASA
jgi:glycosyltransferase involved in cell wall biosynthesis